MKIAFITNIPSPYRVDFFNELGKYCDLDVFFEKNRSSERDASWEKYKCENFRAVFLNGKSVSVDKTISFSIIKYLSGNKYDRIVVMNAATPTGIIAILYMKFKRMSYWIEGDGGFPKSGKGVKERIKKFILSGAEGYFSTSGKHDEYYLTYGVPEEKIKRYPFTSVYKKDVLEKPVSDDEKREIKKRLCIPENKLVLAVGRFIYGKGFDVLLEAATLLDKNISICIAGGNPTEEMREFVIKNNLSNVFFENFKSPEKLRQYYRAADVFVLPTRMDVWGLVINEAMSNGLPVITTENCIAGLEMVKEGQNGFIIPIDNEKALAERIENIIENDPLRKEMSFESIRVAEEYTIEKMAERHIKVLK